MNTLQSLLRHLSENNVKLHVENNKIKYKDSNKTVQGEVLERLKEHKQEIIDLLNKSQLGDHSKMLGGFQSGDAIPVSQYQRSLLFSEQLTKAGEGNNLALSFRFDTAVDESKLYQAVRELFVSNDALRLGYQHHNGDWQATLNDHQANKIEVEKSSEEALIAQYGSLENCCINYIKEKFPFDGSPLAKAKIIQLGEHGYLLTIVVHHAVCDGISLSYLSQQLEQNYERKVGSLADVERASYLDYLVWQQKHADKKSVSYWQNKLAGIPDTIDLPFDMTRPNHMTFSGSTYKVALPETHNDRLAQLSKSLGVSQFNLLLAAFNVFLSRYCAQDDIVVGVPFANREQADTEQMIGLFINTLPIRVQHDSKATFTQLVSQVSDVLQEASIHQHSPLVEIIEAVNPIRSASYSPLFQVLVNYLDVPKEAVKSYFQKSVFELGEQNEQLAKYDLSLNIYKLGDKHELVFEYNNVLFFQKTVQRMAEQFTVLVGELLAAPTIAVNEHTMLTKLDEELINEINNTSSPLPSLKNPYLLVARTANLTPEKTALVFQNEEITFSQFNHRIEQIASYLVAAKVRKGDRVGLYFIRCVDMVCAMYACFRLGAVYVPLDPSYPNKRIAYICEDTQPNCILSLSALSSKLSALQTSSPIVYVDEPQDITVQELPEVEIGSSDTAYVIHTSGTTGNPKGVEVSHGNLQNLLVSLDDTFDKQAVQTWLAQTSISFDISIVELIWTLSRGKKVVLQQSKPADLVKLQGTQSTRPLTFSIMFFSADSNEQDKYQLMLESSQYADKNGFHAVWLPERHFGEFGGAFASPSVTCAALSTITKQIQLRAGSVVLPLHDPIRVAEEWSMIDNLSNGRVGLALASGWHPNDFVFQGSDYENRHQVLREKQTQLQDLWRGKPITRLNGLAKEHKITIRPTPKQAVLPTWITAAGNPETFRYAGEIGANILTHMLGQTLTQLRENIAIYHQELKKHGHQVIDKQVTLMLHTYLDSSKDLALSMTAKPFKSYIGSSVNLIAPLAQEVGMDMEKQKEQIIDIAFERLSETSALFGTADSCQELLHSVHEIGVTEIASLIDFGVATEHVMSSLEKLKQAQDKHVSHCQLVNLLQSAEYESELELIEKHAVTHVQMTPSQAKILYKQYEQGKYNLKVTDWLLGGEMLPSGLVKQLTGINQSRCHNMYGPTETTVWSAWQDVTDASVVIGKPIRNTQFVLLDERKKPVPVGMSGQLYIGGQGVSKGYWRKPELTAQSFTEISINGKLTGRYYSTGDLMRMTSEGFFEYLGRIDDQIKINGYRIEQKEIEKNITDLEGIKDCKVVVKRKSEGEAYLSAYAVSYTHL
ncbi:MAG TPA: LLM class flavin-dependent oxidoreductase, partial [Methylophaga sp.]|nr:LLM class flavin-dependent oxidoreductase [Methylophaga sp.]